MSKIQAGSSKPIMVRLDDDIAERLREQKYRTGVPMNRIINDTVRRYLDAKQRLESSHFEVSAERVDVDEAH
jgi:predicted transcriptional regulator